MRKKPNKKNGLILLCWFAYTCSYIGKLGYTANIVRIEETYNITHATAGMVSTFFFFAYGVGQIINGILCRRYNERYIIFSAFIISAVCNLLMGILPTFNYQKYIWFINGALLSVLWPSLIKYISVRLQKEEMAKAVVSLGTTTAVGTALAYGLSALFAEFFSYRIIFYVAAIVLPAMAIVWVIFSAKYSLVSCETHAENESSEIKNKLDINLFATIIVLAVYAVITNLTKDGLTTWVPVILKETYSLPDSLSILLTLFLPVLAIFGTVVVVQMRKKIFDLLSILMILFSVNAVLIGLVNIFLSLNVIVTLISFALVSCFTSGISSVITSIIPLYWKDKINSGTLAGVLNGFCYVGSTISSYGLGKISDMYGWNVVLWLLCILCIICVVFGILHCIFNKKVKLSKD